MDYSGSRNRFLGVSYITIKRRQGQGQHLFYCIQAGFRYCQFGCLYGTKPTFSSWWFQPLWKIWVKMGSSSPKFGMKISKYFSCHHPPSTFQTWKIDPSVDYRPVGIEIKSKRLFHFFLQSFLPHNGSKRPLFLATNQKKRPETFHYVYVPCCCFFKYGSL